MSCRALAVAAAALAFTACNSARKLESKAAVATCTRCHGDPARPNGAPPRDTRGETATTSVSVGAHQSHLTDSHNIAAPVPCEACHVVPAPDGRNHPDGVVQVTFGAVARPNGAAASWSRADATCSVYCHGATLPDGAAKPVWTRVDGSQAACTSCHGAPPAAPHPQRSDCNACHPATVTEQGTIDVAGGKHLDGVVEKQLTGCTDCHGQAGRTGADPLIAAAPPVGPAGERDTTDLAVGAHQAHLVAGNVSAPIACAECHAVPTSLDHADGVAQVTFGPSATRGRLPARWDASTANCAAVYCHGATLPGGLATSPVWTRVDGTQRRCDSCHGNPPPAPHPPDTDCATCHPGTVDAGGAILVANGLHLNGKVDVHYHPDGWAAPSPDGRSTPHGRAACAGLSECKRCHGDDLAGGNVGVSCDGCHEGGGTAWRTDCTFCHGDPNRGVNAAAPPSGPQGELSTGDAAVGAHQAHLAEGPMGPAMACASCHSVPTDLSHVDGVADVSFGGLATKDSPDASWSGATCSATYCHGATLAGGSNTTPQWTKVDGTQAACGTCHGLPPQIAAHAGVGTDLAACAGCHGATMTASGALIPASQGGKHLDGQVEVSSNHGDGWTDTASPNFHAYSANAGIAACGTCHGADLSGGVAGLACADCHGQGFTTTCTGCHGGTANATGAPPRATWGNTAPQATGAHTSHVAATHGLAAPIDCVACHVKPASALSAGHVDGAVAVTGYTGSDPALAAALTDPGYARSGAGASCATSYCHGATLLGGTNTRPSWTVTNGTQAACGTCHGRPPLSGPDIGGYPAHKWHTYKQNLACQTCHDGYSQTSANPATHVNGVRDVRVRYLACLPQGCDPSLDPSCTCTEDVATIVGWDCASCHSKFNF